MKIKLLTIIFKGFFSFKNNKNFAFFSYFAIAGIAIGIIALNLTLAIIDGLDSKITTKIFSFNSHIVVSGFSNKNLSSDNIFQKYLYYNQLSSISPYTLKYSVFKYKSNYDGILLKGISNELDNSELKSSIIYGKYDVNYNPYFPPLLISNTIAQKYNIKLNDKITIISLKSNQPPSIENPPVIFNFFVKGIFETGISEFDNNYFYTNLKNAQEIFDMKNEVSGFDIKIKNLSDIHNITKLMNNNFNYPYYAKNIYQIYSNIFTWIEFQKKPIPIIIFFITIVAIFNIISTLIINILVKTNNISVLKIIGVSNFSLNIIFISYALFVGIIGILIGNLISFILSYIQMTYKIIHIPASIYFIDHVPIVIKFSNYLLVSGIAFLITLIFALFPIKIITLLKPIDTLKFE
ncbi:MAG TPA: ABC transporter permease [Ignavibacteriales bacterium]|nr:ABC transporter permease [Ignavibacteriales bacterium]